MQLRLTQAFWDSVECSTDRGDNTNVRPDDIHCGGENTGANYNWTSYTYTNGIGNQYDLEKCIDENGQILYKWGNEIYSSWDDLVNDMLKYSQPSSYDAQSPTFKGGYYNAGNLSAGYSWDGKFDKEGNPIGRSVEFKVGAVGEGKNTGFGVNAKFKF